VITNFESYFEDILTLIVGTRINTRKHVIGRPLM